MPKLTRAPTHHRYSTGMPMPLGSSQPTMSYYSRQQVAAATDYYGSVATTANMAVPSYDNYAVAMPTVPTTTQPQTGAAPPDLNRMPSLPSQHRASSGAWNPQDDAMLLSARAQGQNWAQIQQNYFPGKTPNACRKRHERLMERKGADDWDARKLERMAKEYMSVRKEIWTPLALRLGEKWNVVEHKCMSNGLKNLQSSARAHARRERLEAGQPIHPYDDDSGVSGIDLTPIEGLDDYGSPGASAAGSSASGASGSSTASQSFSSAATAMNPHHHQPGYAGYAGYAGGPVGPHHGYSSSVGSTGTAAYAHHGQGGGHHSQSASPYMGHGNRMPSVDMGIDAIINRPRGQHPHGV